MGYEQMELDVTLTCDRELKDNVGLDSAMKKVSDDMKLFLRILPAGSSEAISAASSLKNSAIEAAFEAVKLAANADKIMNDLYKVAQSETTPMEDYLEDQDGEFEEAEDQDPEEAEEMQEDNEDE